ncbi:MAG: phosphopeptide-binding protein [Deltaproteobacteria bacterium]|nr:MAG: phosphopeptide-binding protein [Deltaproteobacteria bacterium]
MIVCPRCAKENQDHYKFCLGCGAELPRDAAQAPKSFTAPTPPAGFEQDGGTEVGSPPASEGPGTGQQFGGAAAVPTPGAPAPAESPAPAPAAAPATGGESLTCPKCSNSVPFNFKFCGSCGHPMADVEAAPAAPAAPAADAPAEAAPAAVAPAAAAAPAAAGRGALVLIRPDGTEGESFPISDGSTTIGRTAGGVFEADSYLSPTHATFSFSGDALEVKDEDSLNGIYIRVDADRPNELQNGSIFRIGQEILRFEELDRKPVDADGVELMGSPDPGYLGRIRLMIGRETYGNSYCVPPEGLHLGRERGDIIFPDDGYVSGLHCRIHGEGGKIFLTDAGSSNGTFMRVDGTAPLRSGIMVLMGQQLFRVEY